MPCLAEYSYMWIYRDPFVFNKSETISSQVKTEKE